MCLREIKQLAHILDRLGNTGDGRDLRAGGDPAGGDLVAQIDQGLGVGAHPDGTRLADLGRE